MSTRTRRVHAAVVGDQPPASTDGARTVEPANDVRPPKLRPACPGSELGVVVVNLPALRPSHDEAEAIAQRLAAILLRAP